MNIQTIYEEQKPKEENDNIDGDYGDEPDEDQLFNRTIVFLRCT